MMKYSHLYKEELLHNVIPFWEKYSIDKENGGYFTCLERDGRVYDTDKFMWLQGRQVWTFSMLYNKVEARQEWLDMAEHGAAFMKKYGRNEYGDWFFSLTREGKPLVQPYNIFSDCFAAMGFASLYKANPIDEYADLARTTFERILSRKDNTKGQYNKIFPGTRPLKGFSLPMILSNLSLEMEHILDKQLIDTLLHEVIHEVMDVFYQPDSGLILESVNPDGSFSDTFEGRLINPGHTIEAMWFIMELAVRINDAKLIEKALQIALNALEKGWDKEFGGILYFLDIKNYPLQQLEWDQKLWWVHIEALVCMAKAYALTGNEQAGKWFKILHDYTWTNFRDKEFGEWFGYLNRRGEVLLTAKGGKWKGCFHIPRGLYQVWTTLEGIPNGKFKSERTLI